MGPDAWQNVLKRLVGRIIKDSERETRQVLHRQRDFIPLVRKLSERTLVGEKSISASVAQRPTPACHAGCYWCCYQRVDVTPVEVLAIADYLRSQWAPDELAALQQRIAVLDVKSRGLNNEQRFLLRQPCALLRDGLCSIYAVRPFPCRALNMLDAQVCRDALTSGTLPNGPSERIQLDVNFATQIGIDAAIQRLHLDNTPLELTAALRIALEQPDARERWQHGEAVFQPAAANQELTNSAYANMVEMIQAGW
ncbi:MAG: YkgJ family cysteine cluster protein [Chloroflexi bacterium]|nr:YkgJ family cysteine cluster protein [Chloroflexota bacterium]